MSALNVTSLRSMFARSSTATLLSALLSLTIVLPGRAVTKPFDTVRWHGELEAPEGGVMDIAFEIGGSVADSLVLHLPQADEGIVASELRTSGASLRFGVALDTRVECTLDPTLKGGYEGICVDNSGETWRLTMVPPLPGMLHPMHEIALAKEAAPAHVVESAALLVLSSTGFVQAREGTNGVTCLVERPRIGDLWPVCYDAEGVSRLLPVTLARAELRSQGVDEGEIAIRLAEGYRSGRFKPAQRNGVAYMLSPHARSINPTTGEAAKLSPHLMLYAPFVTSEDIGGAGELLGVMRSGHPDAYIIVRLPAYMEPVKPE